MNHVELIKQIDPVQEYRPQEIRANGWITNSKDNPDYHYILNLINTGHLKARNVCLTGTAQKYYKVLGQTIIDYINEIARQKSKGIK